MASKDKPDAGRGTAEPGRAGPGDTGERQAASFFLLSEQRDTESDTCIAYACHGQAIRDAGRGLASISEVHAPLAQLAEQQTLNLRVRGSSPWRRTYSDLALYPFRAPSCRPILAHVCSTFARQSGPSRTARPTRPVNPLPMAIQRVTLTGLRSSRVRARAPWYTRGPSEVNGRSIGSRHPDTAQVSFAHGRRVRPSSRFHRRDRNGAPPPRCHGRPACRRSRHAERT